MKSYYELEKEDVIKYKDEFRKTPGGKNLQMNKIIVYSILFTSIAILLFYYFVLFVLVNKKLDADFAPFLNHIKIYNYFFVIMLISTILFRCYYAYCLSSWLKVKHKIQT